MQRNKFNIVTDGQYGSCGKGLITTALATLYRPEIISTTNMANAGHTAAFNDDKFIAKALPSAAILKKWTNSEYEPSIYVGPSAAFHLDQLLKEMLETHTTDLHIHPRAGVITEEHIARERDNTNGTKHVASTMQGCGAMLADKVMRSKDLKLARDYDEIKIFIAENFSYDLINKMRNSHHTILHEGAQGFSLDINHGSHYPQCTSRGTTATQNLADMGIPASMTGDIYLVIRPFPIRVGNVIENGNVVGYSGDCYPDQHEITWEQVVEESGAPSSICQDILQKELTTVTKRLRRVFSFSEQQLSNAVAINGATRIALNFANYIDWSCSNVSQPKKLSDKIYRFIERIESVAGIPVTMVGTGPNNDNVCFL